MAVYDCKDPRDYMQAFDLVQKACNEGFSLEIKRHRKGRSSQQRKYLHFLIRYIAFEYGCTEIYMKEHYLKREICSSIFQTGKVDREGNPQYRSESSLSVTEEMSVINNLRQWASMGGIETPDPDDHVSLKFCEQQVEHNEQWI